jgi:hypothetical protein
MASYLKTNKENNEDPFEVLNKFIEFYNRIHNTKDNMFSNINVKDSTATNPMMELFYKYMLDYKSLESQNIAYISDKCMDSKKNNDTNDDYEIYNLIIKVDGENINYYSYSFLSLLKYIIDEEKSFKNKYLDWTIINYN